MKPRILAIETSQQSCSVAMYNAEQLVLRESCEARVHAKKLLPMIKEVLAECTCDVTELDAIAFGQGPGSFTGVRIATSVAQGLAFGANAGLLPVSSLAVLARGAMQLSKEHKGKDKQGYPKQDYRKQDYPELLQLVAVDARMGEVYAGVYRASGELMEVVLDDGLFTPAQLIIELELLVSQGRSIVAAGDAASLLAEVASLHGNTEIEAVFTDMSAALQHIQPSAEHVLAYAKQNWQDGLLKEPDSAAPVYLRGSGAWVKQSDRQVNK